MGHDRSGSNIVMVFRMVYEVIAEHAQLFELRFCDLRFAPVTKHLLVGASDFFSLSVSLKCFYAQRVLPE